MLSQIIRFYGHAMQGMMGAYLEKSMAAFVDDPAQVAGAVEGVLRRQEPADQPELWAQFMQVQAPMMQGMMSNYIEQSEEPVRADAGADAAAGAVGVPELPVPRRPGRSRRPGPGPGAAPSDGGKKQP
jgi:polyhydroxyalkanoate synthesis regulator protein